MSGRNQNREASAVEIKDAIRTVLQSSNGLDEGDIDSSLDELEDSSEVHELFQTASDCIADLFRLSILIRNASPRDRYTKAITAKDPPFIEQFDIDHVRHKFPRLDGDESLWLRIRLGNAITQRRQFLRYCREHHQKLAKEPKPLEGTNQVFHADEQQRVDLLSFELERTTISRSHISRQTRTVASTAASTLVEYNLNVPEHVLDDLQSQSSYATSIGEDDDPAILQVVSLDDVAKGKYPFECPYCWTIVDIRKQRSWK